MSDSKTEKKLKRAAKRIQRLADDLGDSNSPIPRELLAKAKRIEKRKRKQYRRSKP